MRNKIKSPFIARINISEGIVPVRAYIHRAGLEVVYGNVEQARDYLMSQLESGLYDLISHYEYSIPIVWGNDKRKDKIIDVFGFDGVRDKWPGNPDVVNWVWYNGEFKTVENINSVTTCRDTLILLGKEESYRRTTPNFDYYIKNPLNFREFQPLKEFKENLK